MQHYKLLAGPTTSGIVVNVLAGIGLLFLCASSLQSFYRFAVPVRLVPTPISSCNTSSTCSIVFQEYIPSQLEQRWLDKIPTWQDDYCTAWSTESADLHDLMVTIDKVRDHVFVPDEDKLSKRLSRFVFKVTCGGKTTNRTSWIEPLVAALRHPLALCPDRTKAVKYIYDRSYILLETAQDLPREAYPKRWYFDLGASLYGSGEGGASQKYFVEEYGKLGITFDGMYLWEPTPSTKTFTSGFDANLAHKYHYFSTFADPAPQSAFNPYSIMKRVAKQKDFVMFKLDIDTVDVEKQFVAQLFSDPETADLVDEFFFEHHVDFKPLGYYWKNVMDKAATLKDTYSLLFRLRQKGIRAHGWP